jgi:hypothetical protein
MDGSDIVANRLLRFARNDSSLWTEVRSGAVELFAMNDIYGKKRGGAVD